MPGMCRGGVRKRKLVTLKRDILCDKTRGHLEAPLPVTSDLPPFPQQLRTRWLPDLPGVPVAAGRAGLGREGAAEGTYRN